MLWSYQNEDTEMHWQCISMDVEAENVRVYWVSCALWSINTCVPQWHRHIQSRAMIPQSTTVLVVISHVCIFVFQSKLEF